MKFLWLVLWDPAQAFDWRDPQGKMDHGKVGTFLFVWVVLLLFGVWGFTRLLPLGHFIAGLAALFGGRMFHAFLRSRTVTAAEGRLTVDETVKVIQERRRAGQDVEPSP